MNNYGAIVETLSASDLYALPLSTLATPPNDITVPAAACSVRFIGVPISGTSSSCAFDRRDMVFLKGLSLFSNLGDGLVPANKISNAILLRIDQVNFCQTDGTIANTAGSATLTGTGTSFTRDVAPGQKVYWRDANQTVRVGTIAAVASDTSLTLTAPTLNGAGTMFTGNTTTGVLYASAGNEPLRGFFNCPLLNQPVSLETQLTYPDYLLPLSGRVMTTLGSTILTGIGTKFLTELEAGSFIRVREGVNMRTLLVASVTSDTQAVLTVPGSGTAGVPFTTSAPVSTGASADGWNVDFVSYRMSVYNNMTFYTISIDPSFAASSRLFLLGAQAEVQHDITLTGIVL